MGTFETGDAAKVGFTVIGVRPRLANLLLEWVQDLKRHVAFPKRVGIGDGMIARLTSEEVSNGE